MGYYKFQDFISLVILIIKYVNVAIPTSNDTNCGSHPHKLNQKPPNPTELVFSVSSESIILLTTPLGSHLRFSFFSNENF